MAITDDNVVGGQLFVVSKNDDEYFLSLFVTVLFVNQSTLWCLSTLQSDKSNETKSTQHTFSPRVPNLCFSLSLPHAHYYLTSTTICDLYTLRGAGLL